MVAILFSSLGIPMLASGQDFYHSKGGVSNTYQMGDLNALDYDRLKKYRKLHAYCRNWIAFRQSSYGLLFRRSDMPPNSYFRFFFTDGYSSFAVLVNADESAGKQQILFAVNPHQEEVVIEVSEAIEPSMAQWRPRADEHRFFGRRRMVDKRLRGNSIHLEALSCGLWVRELP